MFTIGADPEFFLVDEEGEPMIACGMLGGTKEEPIPLALGMKGFAVQEDNVMAEYNIPPARDAGAFALYIDHGRQGVLAHARARNKTENIYPSGDCSLVFTDAQLIHPQAQRFGCSRDFDAYRMGAAYDPIDPANLVRGRGRGAWRFAGGHIHVGYKEDLGYVPEFVMAAFMDATVALGMVANGWDRQGERRKWYGTPGRYRPTPYGIEYRTLSNLWTLSNRSATYAAQWTLSMLERLHAGGEMMAREWYAEWPWEEIRAAINSESVRDSRRLFHITSAGG